MEKSMEAVENSTHSLTDFSLVDRNCKKRKNHRLFKKKQVNASVEKIGELKKQS